MFVKVCRGNLQVLRNCRSIQTGRQRIDLDGNCKRIQRLGVQGTRLRQLGFGASFRWQPRADYAGRLEKEKAASLNWKVGSRFVPTCAVSRIRRRLSDYCAQRLTEEQRTVWNSRRWKIERWECAVSRAASESACYMHALQ